MVIIGKDVLQGTNKEIPREFESQHANSNICRACIRVSNLQASIKFYCHNFGFRVQKMLDVPGGDQRALLSAGIAATFSLELLEAPSTVAVTPGWFVHFTLVVDSTQEVLNRLKDSHYENLIVDEVAAVIPFRALSPDGGQSSQDVVSLVKDLDSYTWKIMECKHERTPISEPLCSITLRTTNLKKSIDCCSRLLGTTVSHYYEAASQPPEYKTAMLGYGPEFSSIQLEFLQTETPPLSVERGNGFVRLVVGCSNLAAVEAALLEAEEDVEKVEIGSVEEPGETAPALLCVVEPDGVWEACFVSNM
jgi:catechol 2,3-dioxygenase-like lactoylglutathione lyase family enzyme